MDQVVRPLMVCDGCASRWATALQPFRFLAGATKRNRGATARNRAATEAQPSIEDSSATAQPAAYRQPVRLHVPAGESRRVLKDLINPQSGGTCDGVPLDCPPMRIGRPRRGQVGADFSKGVTAVSTISEVCRWCGISRPTFYRALNRGVVTVKPRGRYDIREVARALIKDAQAVKGGHGDYASKLALSEARAALAREQAAALRMKNAITRREYVSLAVVRREVETMFAVLRERLLSIPGKIAAPCEMRERRDVEEIMRDEVHELLDELSKPVSRSRRSYRVTGA